MNEATIEHAASARSSEPNEVELQHTAQAARDALASSLARLDDRVKHMRSTAVEASTASGLGLAAACVWWLSTAIDPPRHVNGFVRRPPLGALVLRTALKAASLALTGALVYASYRHARKVAGT